VRFEKNYFLFNALAYYNAGIVVVNLLTYVEVVGLAPGVNPTYDDEYPEL
jgi:hypothetical protein